MNYSLIIQHSVTKQVYTYDLEDNGSGIYYRFAITLDGDMPEGEYQYFLIENPHKYEVITDINNIKNIDLGNKILVTYNNTLTTDTRILSAGKQIVWLSSGLLRIGDYENNRYEFDKPSKYMMYERK